MQDSRFASVARPGKLLAYLFLQRLVFLSTKQGISDPCTARASHIVEQSKVPLLSCLLSINQQRCYFDRRHTIYVVVACEELIVHHKWLRIAARWCEVAELIVERPVVIEFDLGEIRSEVVEFIEWRGRILIDIDAKQI